MYATTDGSGAGFGPAQVWTSKDFVNWTLMPMNWPDSHWIWAPDVMQHSDGKYYYFYCQPCIIHCGVSETPRGPWKNILGDSEAVLIPDRFVTNAITLDGQTFVDDDGSVYMYWGTWGIYKGFGCGAGIGKFSSQSEEFYRKPPHPQYRSHRISFESTFCNETQWNLTTLCISGPPPPHIPCAIRHPSDKPLGPYTYGVAVISTTCVSGKFKNSRCQSRAAANGMSVDEYQYVCKSCQSQIELTDIICIVCRVPITPRFCWNC